MRHCRPITYILPSMMFVMLLCCSAAASGVVINEFMADNASVTNDPQGQYDDWIEFHNTSASPVDIAGMYITDDLSDPTKYRIPTTHSALTTIGAGGHLVLWADEDSQDGILHVEISLDKDGEEIGLFDTDGTTLLDSVVFGSQTEDVSLGRWPDGGATWHVMPDPTPGSVNIEGFSAQADGPGFSHGSGTYTGAFTLILTSSVPAATIRYTSDGSLPSEFSDPYAPISIDRTIQIRAQVYAPGMMPSPVATETYILLDADAQSFSSDLPIVIIDNVGVGDIPAADPKQSAVMAIFEKANGRSSLTNAPTLFARTGIRRRGDSTMRPTSSKPNLALETWTDAADDERDISPLGMPPDSDWVLHAPDQLDRSLILNAFTYEVSNQAGRYASRTRFVEVFLNAYNDTLSYADNYYGVYVMMERVKRNEERVDIQSMSPADNAEPDITGGYLITRDRGDAGKTPFATTYQSPTNSLLRYYYCDYPRDDVRTAAQWNYITNYFQEFEDLLFSGSFDPATGYATHIDVESFVDYWLLNLLMKNSEGAFHSQHMYKDRGGKLTLGPIWDFDRTADCAGDSRAANPAGWDCDNSWAQWNGLMTGQWWYQLCKDPDYWQTGIDRWHSLRQGIFSTANLHAVVDSMSSEIAEAQVRNFQAWGWAPRTSWEWEIGNLKTWLSNRVEWIDGEFLDAPTYNQTGGAITGGFELTIGGPAGAAIYYTLDGADPRSHGGSISPTAIEYLTPVTLSSNTVVRARSYDPTWASVYVEASDITISSSIPWSGPSEAVFIVTAPTVSVTEVMYHPRDPTAAETGTNGYSATDFEFIEIWNTGETPASLLGLELTDGVEFDFTYGAVTDIGTGECVVVVENLAAFTNRYTNWASINIAGEYSGNLDNGGERIVLEGPLPGQTNAIFRYDDARGWPVEADGAGHSLVPLAMTEQSDGRLDYGGNWRESAYIDGSPGQPDPDPVVDVLINEFAAHTDTGFDPPDDSDDWIEVYSVSNMTLTDWYLSDDADDLKQWQIPTGTVITAGSWLTFYESTGFHSNRVDGFGLDKAGEQIFLSHLPGTDQDRVADCVSFEGQENGASWGRYPDGAEFWYAMTLTPTASNRLDAVEPVISQIMYHPPSVGTNGVNNTEHEYIVIHNGATSDVELWNAVGPWRINGIGYTLPSNTVIGAGETLTIVPFDPADAGAVSNFLSTHNLQGTLPLLLGPHGGTLANTGERLALERPQAPDTEGASISWVTVDEVIYSSAAPWPDASANGAALHRLDLRQSGNDPLNWTAQPAALDRPKIMLTSPWTGSTMFMPFSHTATAIVNDDKLDGALQHVEFFLNGAQSLGTDTAAPFEAVIDHTLVTTAGTYTVHAEVVDDGGSASSVAAVFTADLATRVGISSPLDGTSIVPPFSTNLVAWVDDEHVVGDVTITFLSGSDTLGVDDSPPYEIAMDETDFPAPGTYPLYAVLDDDFASSTSGVSFLTVEALRGLPFVEGFEGYAVGSSLDGQDPDNSHPWEASDVVVTNDPVRAGNRAAALTSETAVATQTFNDGQTDVWADLYVQPVFAADAPSVNTPPAGTTFAFYVHTNGQVVAYNGTNETQLTHAPLTEGRWVRFSVHSDHTAKTWDLYLNGKATPIATGLGFFDSTPAASYTELSIRGAGSSNALVDSITIGTDAPAMNAGRIGTVIIGR